MCRLIMGRARVRMELIKNEKTRQSTFEKRKICLKKKALELSTLCDVKVGIIIYGPKSASEPEIWPSTNPDDIKELIQNYKNQPIDDKKKRTTNLSNFFDDRKNKSATALSKLQKKNNESQYPTWNNVFNELSEEGLREVARAFEAKIEAVKARFESLKANNYAVDNLFRGNNVELESVVHPQLLDNYGFDYLDTNLRERQMIMALMNNSADSFQFGDVSSYLPPLEGGASCYNPMIGMAQGSMELYNPVPLTWFNEPTVPQQYPGMAGPLSQMDDYYYNDQNNKFN
ncbi:hypothetical protein LguiA_024131 [Lonicera macranthoides]